MGVTGADVSLRQLPPNLQLSSLQLSNIFLQLQKGSGCHSVLEAAAGLAALKQLCIRDCESLDGSEGLAAAVPLLPAGLEHLSIRGLHCPREPLQFVLFPTAALLMLQQLAALELAGIILQGPDKAIYALQPLQVLTRLVDLRLAPAAPSDMLWRVSITAGMLSGAHHLTHLELGSCSIEPGALAGNMQLQHLNLHYISGCAAGIAQLLSHLQPLKQLTHLDLGSSLGCVADAPAAAYSALTTSSRLQFLCLSQCVLPAGAWEHVFPTGRQLPQLQERNIAMVQHFFWSAASVPVPEGSRLVSCCPGLQRLAMQGLQCSAELLAPLQGLTGLHSLLVGACHWHLASDVDQSTAEGLQAVCRLTGLRDLHLTAPETAEALLLQLTQLQHLTTLNYNGPLRGGNTRTTLQSSPW